MTERPRCGNCGAKLFRRYCLEAGWCAHCLDAVWRTIPVPAVAEDGAIDTSPLTNVWGPAADACLKAATRRER